MQEPWELLQDPSGWVRRHRPHCSLMPCGEAAADPCGISTYMCPAGWGGHGWPRETTLPLQPFLQMHLVLSVQLPEPCKYLREVGRSSREG